MMEVSQYRTIHTYMHLYSAIDFSVQYMRSIEYYYLFESTSRIQLYNVVFPIKIIRNRKSKEKNKTIRFVHFIFNEYQQNV